MGSPLRAVDSLGERDYPALNMATPPADPTPPITLTRTDTVDAETVIAGLLDDPPEAMARLVDEERRRERRDGLVATLDGTLNPPVDPPAAEPTIEQLERPDTADLLGSQPWSRHVRQVDRLVLAALLDVELDTALQHLAGLGPASVVWPAVAHSLVVTELHRSDDDPAIAQGALSAAHADPRLAAALAQLEWPEAAEVGDHVRRTIASLSAHGAAGFETRRRNLVDAYAGLTEPDRYRAVLVTAVCALHIVSVYRAHRAGSPGAAEGEPADGVDGIAEWYRRKYHQETTRPLEEVDEAIDLSPNTTDDEQSGSA